MPDGPPDSRSVIATTATLTRQTWVGPRGRRDSQPGRRRRLRRSVTLTVGVLLLGTVVARAGQSPTVPLPAGVAGVVSASAPVRQAGPAPSGPTSVAAGPATPAPSPEATTPQPARSATAAVAGLVTKGAGTFTVLPVAAAANRATGRTVYFTVEVEDGLPVDHGVFARTVRDILLDPRGWQTYDKTRFVSVTPARAKSGARVDIRVTLASPTTTDRLCHPLQTGHAHVSCWSKGRSVINLYRWVKGASTFGTDLTKYRVYLVNHEVGHGLGYQHVTCPKAGARAPIMVQQTLGLQGCTAWPYPTR